MNAVAPGTEDMLKIRGLSKSYGSHQVLRDIDLDYRGTNRFGCADDGLRIGIE